MSHQSRLRKTTVQTPGRTPAPNVFIPTLERMNRALTAREWVEREFREGGYLRRYLHHEVHQMPHLLRQVARRQDGFRQNNRSEYRRLATLPARLYMRLKAMDPHFFEDDKNLKSLRRDNADVCVYV